MHFEINEKMEEFHHRGSALFRSLRSKKEKITNTSKPSTSKSIFAALPLADYGQQMQFDQSNYSNNLPIEYSNEVLRSATKMEKTTEKFARQKIAVDDITDKEENSKKQDDCDSPKKSTEIVLKVDPHIFEVYEDVLFNILHHLNEEIDSDLPAIDKESAFNYVRDAFGISKKKHKEIFEKVKARQSPEIEVEIDTDVVDGIDRIPNKEKYCFLTAKVNNFEALEAHCCLIKVLLKHELESSQAPHFYWSGKFSLLGAAILDLHSDFNFLSSNDLSFIQWSAFTEIHRQHPIDLNIFINILESIIENVSKEETTTVAENEVSFIKSFVPACFGFPKVVNGLYPSSDALTVKADQLLKTKDEKTTDMFWKATKVLNDSFLLFIENLNEESDLENIKIDILRKIFMIVNKIQSIQNTELNDAYKVSIELAIVRGTSKYFFEMIDEKKLKSSKYETRLDELIRVVVCATTEYAKISDRFNYLFETILQFNFSESLYKSYDVELTGIIKPITKAISSTKEGHIEAFVQTGDNHKVAKKLFELYMLIKEFSDKGIELFGSCEFQMKEYSSWFTGGIDKWSKVSVFNALMRIEKAIQIDNLKPVHGKSLISTSAVDTLTVLYSVKKFWEDLKWQNEEDVESIASNVSGDICRFSVIYFDNIATRVEQCEAMLNNVGIFKIPLEVCVVICNIKYVSQGMQDLIFEVTINKIQDNSRLQKLIGNALKHGKSRITKLTQISVSKMSSSIRKLLIEGADIAKKDYGIIGDRLITFIDDTLSTLLDDLDRSDFEAFRNILWRTVLEIFSELIIKSVNNQRPPSFFSNLRTILQAMEEVFDKSNETDEMHEKKKQIDFLLERYELNTSKLIHQYFKDRYQMQLEISKQPFNPFGVLTVQCFFINNVLKLEILSARNLVPIGNNRKCDSFVKISFVPDIIFPEFQNYRTKVVTDTHFPLYDEMYEFELTDEQRNMKDATIFFNIKHRLLLSSNQCLAEAFLSFADIPDPSIDNKKAKQIHLTLTRLQSDDMESLSALHVREQSGDKTAKEFLTKVRSKIIKVPTTTSKDPITKL